MAAVRITHGNVLRAPVTEVEPERLSIIGYLDLRANGRYPIPYFAVDDDVRTASVTVLGKTCTRVYGILPDYYDTDFTRFRSGIWECEIDIPGDVPSGKGSVYLGQGDGTNGHVFEHRIPFDYDKELEFVHTAGGENVLVTEEFEGKAYHLVYASPETLQSLGQLSLDFKSR